jgi:hypothetical protein
LLLDGASAPIRPRPNAAPSASAADLSNLARASTRSEGSGSQATTKSPPGPNLHNGSDRLSLSGIISIVPAFKNLLNSVQSQVLYRQGEPIYPNKNRTENRPLRDFFWALGFLF